jgi:hypothetical protein
MFIDRSMASIGGICVVNGRRISNMTALDFFGGQTLVVISIPSTRGYLRNPRSAVRYSIIPYLWDEHVQKVVPEMHRMCFDLHNFGGLKGLPGWNRFVLEGIMLTSPLIVVR